jgi:hypothetical protein
MSDETKRIILKHGTGVPTIPTSNDHRDGTWIATDIYPYEVYVDSVSGLMYINSGGLINEIITDLGTKTFATYNDIQNQTAAAINTGYAVKFRTLNLSSGISVLNDTKITLQNTGYYNLSIDLQFLNTDNQEHDANVWIKKNGTNIVSSNGLASIPATHGGIHGHTIFTKNFLIQGIATDYFEVFFSTSNTLVSLATYTASSPSPSTPSAQFTINQL